MVKHFLHKRKDIGSIPKKINKQNFSARIVYRFEHAVLINP